MASQEHQVDEHETVNTAPPSPEIPTPLSEVNRENIEAQTAEVLEGENKGFFEKMSGKAKELASKAYEGLYKVPVVNRVVGKMEIAYKQFWADRHNEKAAEFKGEMETIDVQHSVLNSSKEEMQRHIEELQRQGIPGASSLEVKVKQIAEKQANLANQKDRFQTKLENRNGKTQKWIDKRDAVASRLIENYGEKLKPLEANLDKLHGQESELELEVSFAEVRHRETNANLNAIERDIVRLETMLQDKNGMRMSERQAKKFEGVVAKRKVLDGGRARLKQEQANLAKRKREIRVKISEADAKANPYRGKREEFVRVKAGRPIEVRVPARARTEIPNPEGDAAQSAAELREQGLERVRLDEGIADWNRFMQQRYGREAGTHAINVKEFLQKGRFSSSQQVDRAGFSIAIRAYSKYLKRPAGQVEADLSAFLSREAEAAEAFPEAA